MILKLLDYTILLSILQNILKWLFSFEDYSPFHSLSTLLRQLLWSVLSLLTFYANLNITAILLSSSILIFSVSFAQFSASLSVIDSYQIRRRSLLDAHSFAAFQRSVVLSLELMHHSNAFYGQLFLVNLAVLSPINAQLVLWICFGWGLTPGERAYLSPFAALQLTIIFGVHYLLTRYSRLFHRSGTACARLMGRGVPISSSRLRLKVAREIWILNSADRRYGIYYGRAKLAIVTTRTFQGVCF